MKKFYGFSIILVIFFFAGCGNNKVEETINKNNSQNLIENYLDAVSEGDMEKIKDYSTDENSKSFNEEILNVLKDDVESLNLLKCEIRTSNESRALVDSEVEVICSDDFIATGDWKPGKTISTKTFELIKVNNQWKINGWGVY